MGTTSVGFFLALVVSFPVFPKAQAQTTNHDQELVRVRLFSTTSEIKFEGQGLKVQGQRSPYQAVAIPQNKKTSIRVLTKNGKTLWAVKWPDRLTEVLIPGRFLSIDGESLRAGPKNLPEKIILSAEKSKIDVVGVVPLRDYLVGVLKSEMPLGWPLETLKAQAVAARSYALAVMKEREKRIYHLESSILDQVYEAIHFDSAHASVQKAIQAVDETRDEILQDSKLNVLKAFFHADCGGKTIHSQEVWKGGVTVGTAHDQSCPNTPTAQWTYKMTSSDLERKLNLGAIAKLHYLRNTESGRVNKVDVVLKNGQTRQLLANDFRSRIGFKELKSTWFRASLAGNDLIFSGKGFGHGVGLCQWGSRNLGQKGLSYKAILKHYYPLALLN